MIRYSIPASSEFLHLFLDLLWSAVNHHFLQHPGRHHFFHLAYARLHGSSIRVDVRLGQLRLQDRIIIPPDRLAVLAQDGEFLLYSFRRSK